MTKSRTSSDKLPYDKHLLEGLAALVMDSVLGSQGVQWIDRGQGSQVHDFDLNTVEGRLHVEVTTALERSYPKMVAALQQHQTSLASLGADWWLELTLDRRASITRLARHMSTFLDSALSEASKVDTTDASVTCTDVSDGFRALGVIKAYGFRTAPGQGKITILHSGVSFLGGDSVADAVEHYGIRDDNVAKLSQAGGGHLFVWIDASDPAHLAFWNSACISTARTPHLPEAIRCVWAGQLFAHTVEDGTLIASCGGLWRAVRGAAWEDLTSMTPHDPLKLRHLPVL